MSKVPCQCPPCRLLAILAMDLAVVGLVQEAELLAREITWLDSADAEGYTDAWVPTRPDDLRVN